VTRHSIVAWLARQINEACTWASAPAYLVRDNGRANEHVFTTRVTAMGIRDRKISLGSPWQNGYAERVGTVSRKCLDQMLIFGEGTCAEFLRHMRRITIRCARTWHYRKMRPCIDRSNGLAPLSPFPFWPDSIINTYGYNFRKGQEEYYQSFYRRIISDYAARFEIEHMESVASNALHRTIITVYFRIFIDPRLNVQSSGWAAE
jgi:hypothetical protein